MSRMRFFNIAGPCLPELHYMIPPDRRLPGLAGLVDKAASCVVHAPRPTGKTTVMKALARSLTDEGRYAALWFTCEEARAFREDVGAAEHVIWASIESAAQYSLPESLRPPSGV